VAACLDHTLSKSIQHQASDETQSSASVNPSIKDG
jgi:hypothetical protein